jgi:hypothetical protein
VVITSSTSVVHNGYWEEVQPRPSRDPITSRRWAAMAHASTNSALCGPGDGSRAAAVTRERTSEQALPNCPHGRKQHRVATAGKLEP